MNVTAFKGIGATPVGDTTVDAVLKKIRLGSWKDDIINLRHRKN